MVIGWKSCSIRIVILLRNISCCTLAMCWLSVPNTLQSSPTPEWFAYRHISLCLSCEVLHSVSMYCAMHLRGKEPVSLKVYSATNYYLGGGPPFTQSSVDNQLSYCKQVPIILWKTEIKYYECFPSAGTYSSNETMVDAQNANVKESSKPMQSSPKSKAEETIGNETSK